MTQETFATPRNVKFEDCEFYHTVDIPDHGVVAGQWDLRGKVDEYLGHYRFAGKRVLEIGPASGFLTFEMEKRGADVVALEVPDDPGWDFVPFPDERMAPIFEPRRVGMNRIKNSFWFLHALNASKARLCYGNSSSMPDDLGRFDAAVMASVLLHCERPPRIIAECARRADTLIISDIYRPDLEGSAVCRLVPKSTQFTWDTWWEFGTTFFEQYFGVLGFPNVAVTTHHQFFHGHGLVPYFTIIGSKHPINEIAGIPVNGAARTAGRTGLNGSGANGSGANGSVAAVSGGGRSNKPTSPSPAVSADNVPVPPPELRHRVTGTDSDVVFVKSGELSLGDITRALAGVGRQLPSFERVLDWGCGAGRVTRWLGPALAGAELFGVDIDPLAIGWCAQNLPFGTFSVCQPWPPLDFPDNHFDLVVNHSVLTHLDAAMQDAWLAELRRITRPGGLILLSTHGDGAFATLAADWAPERAAERRKALETEGILHVTEDFVGSPFPDFYQSTFHATWYVFTHWAKQFPILAYYPRGDLSFQDIVVLQRPEPGDKMANAPIFPAGNRAAAAGSAPPAPAAPAPDLERLRGLVDEGPALNTPSRYGALTHFVRGAVRRATDNLRSHQQQIDRQIIRAVGEQGRSNSRLDYGQLMIREGLNRQSDRIARLESQVADLLAAGRAKEP